MVNYIVSFGHFFAAIIYLLLGIIIISKDYRSPLNRSCTAIFICFAIWGFGFTGIHHPATPRTIVPVFENIASIGWIWYSFFHFLFVRVFSRCVRYKYHHLITTILVAIPLMFTYQQFTNAALVDHYLTRPYGWQSQWRLGGWTYLFFIYITIMDSYGLYLLFVYRTATDNPILKRQSGILLWSGILTFLFGSLVNIVFPLLQSDMIIPIADITTLIWAAGLSYTAMKYRMLDITPFVAAQRIITVMKDLLFLLDTRGTIISVNPAACRSLHCADGQLIGRPFAQLIDNPDEQREQFAAAITGSETWAGETVLALKEKPPLPVVLSTSLIPGIGIVAVAHDNSLQQQRTDMLNVAKQQLETEVTLATEKLQKTNRRLLEEISERKQAAISLMETEQRFRAIFEHAPDGIFLCENNGTIIDGNNETLRITGFEKRSLTANNLITGHLIPSEYHSIVQSLFRTKDASSRVEPVEIEITTSSGGSVPVEITSHPVKISNRELILGVLRDLTQKKAARQESEELRRQFHHAQKLEAIGQLAGGIAHDFNNLLGGIVGYTGLLKKRIEPILPESVEILDKILGVANQAADRTGQLLAFARKGKYQVTTVNMHRVIDDVIGLLELTIDKRISLVNHCNAPRCHVSGDHSQLHGALLNLGINSRDALPDGGTITFSTEVVELDDTTAPTMQCSTTAGTFLKIAVSDDGTGMDETTRNRAFEPFYTTKERGKGSGLGLASTYGILQNHNGGIDLCSEQGKGTTITLYLPLLTGEVTVTESLPRQLPEEPCNGTIMVVDDVDIVRDMVADVLNEQGFTVHPFSDGNAALHWFESNHTGCDLAILDLTMPGISGAECFSAMKTINPGCRVIITSGHAIDHETNELLANGALAFLQKPFEIEMLARTVQKVLASF